MIRIKKLFVALKDLRQNILFSRKITQIKKSLAINGKGSLTGTEIRNHKKYWKRLAKGINPAWYIVYSHISEVHDHRFVPETVYYNRIEPVLNNKAFSKAFTTKSNYIYFLTKALIPETIAFDAEKIMYSESTGANISNEEFLRIVKEKGDLISKPSTDSGGGRGVIIWKRVKERHLSSEGELLSVESLYNRYSKNWILQERINQHPYFASFNQSSLNTIRILTYRSALDEQIKILHTLLRVGKKGMEVDNQASGGYACGITPAGSLSGFAVDKSGNKHSEVNGVVLNRNEVIPNYNGFVSEAVSVAKKFHYSRLLGIDLCLDINSRIRLLEVNDINNEINFYQMNNGPLFGDFTDEVLELCSTGLRSFMVDFDIQ